MTFTVLLSIALSHTPGGFYHTCPHSPIHVHDPNVSQVFYLDLHHYCNYTFEIDGCASNVIMMGRFRETHPRGWMELDGVRHDETILKVSGEPFTTTPMVKTIELKDQHVCTVTLGGEEGEAYFVNGKSEDWWLFLTVPYYSYRVQWQWAYANSPIYLWPLFVMFGAFFFWPARPSRTYTFSAISAILTIDIILPNVAVTQHVSWPTSGIWTTLFILRLLYGSLVLYLVWACETVHMNEDRVWVKTLVDNWCTRFMAFVLWLMGCALSIGFYVLVPLLYWRYTR